MSDDEDDDWFERGLREQDESESEEDASETDEDRIEWGEATGGDDQPASGSNGAPDTDDPFGDSFGDDGTDDPFGDTGDDDAFGESGSDGASSFGDTGADDDPFGGGDSPFGDTGADDDPFGGGSSAGGGGGGGQGLFDDDFSDAMGAMGGGDSGADFEDEDFETEIPRLDIGIEGLDNMIQGGIPERHLVVIIGGPGTGKTTFGLQYLRHGLELDDTDRGVFITLEQTYDDIMSTANERGWEFDRHEDEGDLAVIDLDPVEMANSLDNIRGELPELIEDFGADRFVLDSVSLLEMMYEDVSRRRTEVFDFTQSLKDAGVTTVLTSEANEDNPYASRHGIIEYLTDAVLLLRYVRSGNQETRLAVEIQKIRNANHSRESKPYEITMDGISVYEQANIF